MILSLDPVRGGDGAVESLVGVLADISPQKEVERGLVDLADRDALTGLPNRRSRRLADGFVEPLEVAGMAPRASAPASGPPCIRTTARRRRR